MEIFAFQWFLPNCLCVIFFVIDFVKLYSNNKIYKLYTIFKSYHTTYKNYEFYKTLCAIQMLFLIIVIIGKVGVTGPIPVTSSIKQKSLKPFIFLGFWRFFYSHFFNEFFKRKNICCQFLVQLLSIFAP